MVRIVNEMKILLKLKELDTEVINQDLAELTNIPEKNISRYLNKLESKGLIKRRYESKHQLRRCFNSISSIGREFDISSYKGISKDDKSKAIMSKSIDEKKALKTNENSEISSDFIKLSKEFSISNILLDEWNQIKTYFRKGNRPSQKVAIENFEKHLKDIKRFI